ncbi:MAG: zinc carboxypeptidase, partial [Acidobacteria bacterium]|nr:zinc carboxypeptidase [Acidobacteriota bacterium]
MKKAFLLILTVLCAWTISPAQKYQWLENGTYDAAVPAPESVLGYEIGTYLTDHAQMVDYMRRLEQATEKVRMFEYGQTYEGRRMYLVAISSPENMARLEQIRTTVAQLRDPRK